MKFPSLQSLYSSLKDVFKKFPLEMAFAVLGTIAAIIAIEVNSLNAEAENTCFRIIMISNLGLVLSFAATLFSKSRAYSSGKWLILAGLVILVCAGLFLLLDPFNWESDIFRFILLALAFHLLVSFAGFLGRGTINAFWQFNKTLFLRFLTGALYSAVLFAGLSAAIGSMNFLFNFRFESDTFFILWVLIVGIFQTVFFLSGVPDNPAELENDLSYPKSLKVFTQYVLIPLASVYAFILLAYAVKILVQFRLPEGLVSNLILGYAVFGILSLLLVYPVRNLEENKWIRSYSRSFYYLLIPLIILLILAVGVRVYDYGITEERYFLIILSGWLIFITAYFLISEKQDILLIPLSLCLVTLFSVYGPQSAFSTSRRSQISELRQLFMKHNSLSDDLLKPLNKELPKDETERVINILDYLINNHGLKSLQPLISGDLLVVEDSILKTLNSGTKDYRTNKWEIRSKQSQWVYKKLNIKADRYDSSVYSGYHMAEADDINLIPLKNADYLLNFRVAADSSSVIVNGAKLVVSIKTDQFKISHGEEVKYLKTDTLVNSVYEQSKKQKGSEKESISLSRNKISQNLELEKLSLTILWNRLTFNDHKKLTSGDGVILIKVK